MIVGSRQYKINQAIIACFALLILLIITASCEKYPVEDTEATSTPAPSTFTSQSTHAGETPSLKQDATPVPTGPNLLIQTGINTFQILDIGTLTTHEFMPPGQETQLPLSWGISPSGQHMLFMIHEEQIGIMDLKSQEIHTRLNLNESTQLFKVEKASDAFQNSHPDILTNSDNLLTFLDNTLTHSQRQIRWYESDRYLFSVIAEEDRTNLALKDLQSGQTQKLESFPGLVSDYWPGPNGEALILKKEWIVEPEVWQDDRYYLLNLKTLQSTLIPLPENVNNPSVGWLDARKIGIIHKKRRTGGAGFTLIDFSSDDLTAFSETFITASDFDHISLLGNHFLRLLTENDPPGSTTLESMDLAGKTSGVENLDSHCYRYETPFPTSQQILLNCTDGAYWVDASLRVDKFSEAIFLISGSPDGTIILTLLRQNDTALLDFERSKDHMTLTLQSPAFQILWLPDSSGFLYRTMASLRYIDLKKKTDRWVLDLSDVYDYTNLNAVWIDLTP